MGDGARRSRLRRWLGWMDECGILLGDGCVVIWCCDCAEMAMAAAAVVGRDRHGVRIRFGDEHIQGDECRFAADVC